MINKLTERNSSEEIDTYKKYVVKCPCCGIIMNFGREDVYISEDDMCIHHEYIECPECNKNIILDDNYYFGYR